MAECKYCNGTGDFNIVLSYGVSFNPCPNDDCPHMARERKEQEEALCNLMKAYDIVLDETNKEAIA